MKRRHLLLAILLVVLACATAGIAFLLAGEIDLLQAVVDRVDQPAGPDSTLVAFSVNQGDSAASIGERLKEQGLVQNALAFRWLASHYGVAGDLKSGDYELSASMRPSEILARLNRGLIMTTDVVILEGWRLEQIADELDKKNIFAGQDFLRAASSHESPLPFLKERPRGSSLEGYLFPDTYRLPARMQPAEFVRLMLDNFDKKFTFEMRQQVAAEGLSLHEAVTLASIVEREAVLPAEKPVIARVFLNRLQKGMPLQADPTVQYAIGSNAASALTFGYWKGDLTIGDLATSSPYNTYQNPGLPPGPIANPGLASLNAVVDPEDHDYLFFVAKNDGSHAFARTLEEHNANVRRYGN